MKTTRVHWAQTATVVTIVLLVLLAGYLWTRISSEVKVSFDDRDDRISLEACVHKLFPNVSIEQLQVLFGKNRIQPVNAEEDKSTTAPVSPHGRDPGDGGNANEESSCSAVWVPKCIRELVMKFESSMDGGGGGGESQDVSIPCTGMMFSWGAGTVSFPMCRYDQADDLYISGSMARGSLFHPDEVGRMAQWLTAKDGKGFIDIGSNIGTFALTAAHLKHPVIAAEPMPGNLLRLKKSIQLGQIKNYISVVEAGIGDSRDELYLKVGKTNKGDVVVVDKDACLGVFPLTHTCAMDQPIRILHMDDLLDLIHFRDAVLKIDIEGYEMKAFAHAQWLFERINISHVIMEWTTYKWPQYLNSEEGRKQVETFIGFFTSRSYKPTTDGSIGVLNLRDWPMWPNDTVWVK